jgi:hypothetical protein
MEMTYYNTTSVRDPDLNEYRKKADKQDTRILEYFQHHPFAHLAPSQIHQRVFGMTVPITSVRRAMSTLTGKGLLRRTDIKIKGPFGRPECLWSLPKERIRLLT